MKIFTLCLCLVLVTVGCASTPTPIPSTPPPAPTRVHSPQNQSAMTQKLDRYLTRRTKDKEFSGVVLVAQNGTVLLKKAYGFADATNKIPNTVDTRFQLASVSKPLTASAVMLLVERGQIKLEAPLSTYLNDMPAEWRTITVQQLLSHTSGIPDYFTFDEFTDELNLTTDGIIAVAKKYPLDFDPGTDYGYSNTGYILLGKIIEIVSGKAYGAFLRENLFDPLHMDATGRDENNTPLAIGYTSPDAPARMYPITNALGDGDFWTTVDDMYKFDRALHDGTILTPASREKMFTPIGENNYGLGWEVQTWNDKPVLSHSGGINGFATELMRFPEDDTVIIILSNFESADTVQMAWDLAKMVLP